MSKIVDVANGYLLLFSLPLFCFARKKEWMRARLKIPYGVFSLLVGFDFFVSTLFFLQTRVLFFPNPGLNFFRPGFRFCQTRVW